MQMKATIVVVFVALFAVQQTEAFWGHALKLAGHLIGDADADDLKMIREMPEEDFQKFLDVASILQEKKNEMD